MSSLKQMCTIALLVAVAGGTAETRQSAGNRDAVGWSGMVVDPQALPLPGASIELRTDRGVFVAATITNSG